MLISDLGKIVTGKTPLTKRKEYWDGDIPFVTPGDLQNSKHINSTSRYISEQGMLSVKGTILPKDSVCVSCIGNIGYVGKTTKTSVSNQQINSIIVNDKHNADYVYYLMKSLWRYFKNCENQSTTLSILNKTQFSKIQVVDHSREEEDRIAEFLNMLDLKIEMNTNVNDNLEEQAKTVFEKEFLARDHVPAGWTRGSLVDIADYLNGLAMQKYRPAAGEQGLPVLKIKELRQGSCDSNSELCSSSIKKDYIIHDGDVIFSWSGSLLVDFWCGGTCGLNQHLFKITSKKYDKWFYYAWTNSYLQKFAAIAADMATTMGHIKREELAKAEVLIPNNCDYERIGNLLSPIYALIISNRIENRRLASLRDGLLPQLMAGTLDVTDIEL